MMEKEPEESFLKIGMTWSEKDGGFDDVKIKEENLSDVELENSNHEESVGQLVNNQEDKSVSENDGATTNGGEVQVNADETVPKATNTYCRHEKKNFKICKKRLRCCDCQATLCPECHCTIHSSVQTHFSKSDNNNESLYACKFCSMIFRSNCALQAHVRIHLLDTPYVCPDCGAVYNNIYFLSLHLINKCYHVYKMVSNGCKFCASQNMTPEEFVTHFEETHIRPVFKCTGCKMIFQTAADFNRHLTLCHENQNVTWLNYYSCRVCGNLIISKNLYAKHIRFHQEHTAAFQVGYLCSCGQSFNAAATFRCHFRFCSKKGILPPQWTYLQVTLKTQEIMNIQGMQPGMAEGHQNKSDPNKSQSSIDFSMFEDMEGSDVETSGSSGNESDPLKKPGESDAPEKEGNSTKDDEKREENSAESTRQEMTENIADIPVGSNEVINDKPPVEIIEDNSTVTEVVSDKADETEKPEGEKNLKVLYDHIPCDHLGYLKTRKLQDLTLRDGTENDADKFVLTSVLDDRTGLLGTKRVPKTPDDVSDNGDVMHSMCGLQKLRSTSFFSCPFCSVLFSRHLSSFQRFRLHVERYHPDASLDLTVDRSDVPKSQVKFTSITPSDEYESDDESCDLDDVDLQTRLDQSLKEDGKNSENKDCSNDGKTKVTNKEKRDSDTRLRNGKADVEKQECSVKKTGVNNKVNESRTILRSALCKDNVGLKENDEAVVNPEPINVKDDSQSSKKVNKSLLLKQRSPLNEKSRRISEDSWSDKSLEPIRNSDEPKSATKIEEVDEFDESEDNKEELRGKLAMRRNSRRESDVWSEFYKTLKIAETFKKAKVKNAEESTILNNYTNKRVVKKPKRYRESSDSDDSNDEDKIPGDLKSYESRLDDDDDLFLKKKKLMDKLENMDYRVLDYLLKLIDRKQKNVGLLKRNIGCRRKIAYGSKVPARQDDDVGHESDHMDEVECEVLLPVDDRASDRRRGRPKKGEHILLKDKRIIDAFDLDETDFTSKRRRKMSKMHYRKLSMEKNEFSSGLVISTKTCESEKRLTCAVCKDHYQTEAEFREHIIMHRIDDNSHQCMECGECFVVRPSLEKHLHAFHKIKDVDKYIEENECSNVAREEEPEPEPLKENQCEVCRDQFENQHDLNKHFRIHGMAFLRQFKKSN